MRRGVAVAARDRHPRLRQPQLRADDVDDALRAARQVEQPDAGLAAVALERRRSSPRPSRRGTAAADRASGRCDRRWRTCARETRTCQPRARSMSNACGVVTSWIRCRPMNSCVCPFGSFRTVCASHTFSSRVEGILGEWYYSDTIMTPAALACRDPWCRDPGSAGADTTAFLLAGCAIARIFHDSRRPVAITAHRSWVARGRNGDAMSPVVSFRDLDAWGAAMDLNDQHVWDLQAISARRAIRPCAANAPRCGFCAFEHRGRTREWAWAPIPPPRSNRSRLSGGTGNSTRDRHAIELHRCRHGEGCRNATGSSSPTPARPPSIR